ncbi:hypothetical protein ECG_03196 [Echinococcus granulosus]|uniref:Uncharacterized protein n=1 Tax=Echinococcus granulosus TaxID=6210 RepID=W6UJE6_ECHGR|nr:hypothetical protein EGR_04011 [Echinococcus granulosus]EUB61163.1 hypothetical protein EGR_04011 [Echinococcus granulosus]KAH9284044.1 hypothetical protein ECG_03196 [Echinococcus granulosus]
MTLVVCPPLVCSAEKISTTVAHPPPGSPIVASSPCCHLCSVYRQLPKRGKVNHTQGCSTLYLCCYLLSVVAYFMLCTEQNRQRASPRHPLLLYSVNKPFYAPFPTTVFAVVTKERTPTASTSLPSHFCIPFMAHLRQWRWFIVSLIFFYGLGLFVSPARATSIGVALRVFDSSNGSRILGRSQRSTEDFERLLKTDVGFLCLLDGAPEMVEQKFFVGIHKNGTLEVTKGAKRERSSLVL